MLTAATQLCTQGVVTRAFPRRILFAGNAHLEITSITRCSSGDRGAQVCSCMRTLMCSETSHDSNVEKSSEVAIPPKKRPNISTQ
jgi:hypothetical protein